MLPVSLRLTLEGIGPYSYLPTEPLRVQMVQLLVATGAFLFYILAAVIAERRAAEFQQQQRSERLDEEVQARTEDLRAADRRKNEFLAMLAHELRNPLAPIRNVSQLLSRMFRKDADLAKPLAMLDRQTEQLTHLVDDLLDVSRIAQGRIDLTREVLTLSSVVEQAVDMVMPLIREKQHRLEVKQEAGPLLVEGDRARLVQSIGNLLTNATKFTGANGAIELAVRPDGDWVCISVTDNGQGISASLLPRVFDLFVQGERMLDRSQGGLGIGLAVAKRLVEMHGGTVDAASSGEGSGACFTIRLRRLTALPRQAPERPAPTAPARRILIVDDNVDAADSTAMLLRAEGHEVEAVYAAADVLRRAAEWRPDAVLLDIGLPHMDGFEVARRLRSNRQLAGIWLVALTGYGQHEDKLQADEAGFDAHLVKPVNLETLAKVLGDTPR